MPASAFSLLQASMNLSVRSPLLHAHVHYLLSNAEAELAGTQAALWVTAMTHAGAHAGLWSLAAQLGSRSAA